MGAKIAIFASKIMTCVVLAIRYGKNGDFGGPGVDFGGRGGAKWESKSLFFSTTVLSNRDLNRATANPIKNGDVQSPSHLL
jgi:hypothetical protein